MSLVKEICNTGATTAWSPVAVHPSLLAVGTKESAEGSGFDNVGGEISLYSVDYKSFDPSSKTPVVLGRTKTAARFNKLTWGSVNGGPSGYGLIAGGMQDGVINVWDPKNFAETSSQEISTLVKVENHKNKVNSLQFNPISSASHLLASGASDSEVLITDLRSLSAPKVYSPAGSNTQAKHTADVSAVSWNSQVVHILASAALNGVCTVWDMRQNTPWCELRESKGAGFSALCWNPNQGLHLLTATDDDNRPVIRLWDLRSSTTNPLAEFIGHTGGIFSVSWCPHDPMLLMSCAKDNRAILWDLLSGQPLHDLNEKNEESTTATGLQNVNQGLSALGGAAAGLGSNAFGADSAANMFGSPRSKGLSAAGGSGRRYEVEWAPHVRGLLSTCSFDRKVEVFSMNGAGGGKSVTGVSRRAPTWMPKKSGACFAFGGKLISWGAKAGSVVQLDTVVDSPELVQKAIHFEQSLSLAVQQDAEVSAQTQQTVDQNGEYVTEQKNDHTQLMSLCNEKAAVSDSQFDKDVWNFMTVLFEPAARDKILQELGYNVDKLANQLKNEIPMPEPVEEQLEPVMANTNTNILDDQSTTPHDVSLTDVRGSTPTLGFGLSSSTSGDASDVFGGAPPGDAFDAPPADAFDEPAPAATVEPEVVAAVSEAPLREDAVETSASITKPVDYAHVDPSTPGVVVEIPDPKADDLVKKALLLGNFDAAVQCCLQHNRLADALLLATCGGEALWTSTLDKYLELRMNQKPYMPLLSAIIRTELDQLVETSELTNGKWKEVLAIISQYGKSEEVSGLCEMLAGRLERELGDDGLIAATLCYMCAINVEKTVNIWVKQTMNGSGTMTEKLQNIMEKISVFRYGIQDPDSVLRFPAVMKQYLAYAEALAQQGQLDYAASYVSAIGMNQLDVNDPQYGNMDVYEYNNIVFAALVLRDRLYGAHISPEQSLAYVIPEKWFPFETKLVNVAPVPVAAPEVQHQQPQTSYQPQQLQSQNTYQAQNAYQQQKQQAQNTYEPPQQQLQSQQQSYGYHQQNGGYSSSQQGGFQPQVAPVNPPKAYQQNGTTAHHPSAQPSFQQPVASLPQPVVNQPFQATAPPVASMQGGLSAQPPSMAPQQIPPSTTTPPRTSVPSGQPARTTKNPIPVNDGFGTTAGNPAAGQKYGNTTGTSNRFGGDPGFGQTSAPNHGGMAAPSVQGGVSMMNPVAPQPETAPAPAPTPAPVKREMPSGMQPVMNSLRDLVKALSTAQLSQLDNKQLAEGEKSVNRLNEKLMTGKISEALQQDLKALSDATIQYDFKRASQIRLNMTRSSWADQKDWLKGFSHLIALAGKKYPAQ